MRSCSLIPSSSFFQYQTRVSSPTPQTQKRTDGIESTSTPVFTDGRRRNSETYKIIFVHFFHRQIFVHVSCVHVNCIFYVFFALFLGMVMLYERGWECQRLCMACDQPRRLDFDWTITFLFFSHFFRYYTSTNRVQEHLKHFLP